MVTGEQITLFELLSEVFFYYLCEISMPFLDILRQEMLPGIYKTLHHKTTNVIEGGDSAGKRKETFVANIFFT